MISICVEAKREEKEGKRFPRGEYFFFERGFIFRVISISKSITHGAESGQKESGSSAKLIFAGQRAG